MESQIFMFALSLRALVWTFRIDPYTRSTGSKRKSLSQDIWFDAFDLLFNLRGIGWSWPQGLRVPQETRNLTSTKRFLLTTLQWLVQDIIAFDFCLYTIQAMLSKSIGYPTVSIFDPSIPPLLRYVRSTIITIFMAILIHLGIRNHYNLVTLIGITVFQQPPSLWPPVSDRPYNATSLTQFWNTRWHQSFRDIFIQCGGRPLAHFLGKTGGILGGFLISGILHDIGCWGMGRGPDFKSISGFFLMNGVGIILERVYKTLTGKQVGGFAGRIWTFSWLLIWGSLLIDAWCKHGLGATTFWPTHLSPTFHVHKLLFP